MQTTLIQQNRAKFWRSLVQLEPGKPAIAKALRTLVAVAGAIYIGQFLGNNSAILLVVGTTFVSFADVGGAYRTKAIALATATVGTAATMLIGSLASSYVWLYIPLMFIWGFGAGLVSVFGRVATAVGVSIALSFILSFSPLSQIGTAFDRFELLLLGGTWAMILSLIVWPLKPGQPAREAVSSSYSALASFMAAAHATSLHAPETETAQQLDDNQHAVRQALDEARNKLATAQMSRPGQSMMSDQLLELVYLADRLFGLMIALTNFLETAKDHPQFRQIGALVEEALAHSVQVVQTLAKAVIRDRTRVDITQLEYHLDALQQRWRSLRDTLLSQQIDYAFVIEMRNVVRTVEKLSERLHTAAAVVQCLQAGKARVDRNRSMPIAVTEQPSIFKTLVDNLNPQSQIFRHALRLGLTASLAVLIGLLSGLPRGYWVTLSVIVILRPDIGGTKKRVIQRVGGTVLGGLLALILLITVHNQWVLAGIMVILTLVALSLQPLNYGFSIALLTPLVILLFNVMHPGDLQIAGIRILDTAIGGALALVSGYILFPSWERQRFPQQVATTLHANQYYWQQVMDAYLHQTIDRSRLRQARQQAELESANAAASFQKLLEESHRPSVPVEPLMVLVTCSRLFANTVTAIAVHFNEVSGRHQLPGLDVFFQQIDRTLTDFQAALKGEQPLSPLPSLNETLDQIHVYIQSLYDRRTAELASHQGNTLTREAVFDYAVIGTLLDRLADQVTAMHSALTNMNAGLSDPS